MEHAVNIDLPRATSEAQDSRPETVHFTVDAQDSYYLNEAPVAGTELPPRFQAAAAQNTQPELHIRSDKTVRQERAAQVMAAAQVSDMRKIGFVTEPNAL